VKTTRQQSSSRPALSTEFLKLRARVAEAEATLRAIRTGEVDAVVVTGRQGRRVFTLQGAEHAYRVLIESMNEGALTLAADKTILYANRHFARMVNYPLEQVTGSSFRRFLSAPDGELLRPLMKKSARTGSKMQVMLLAGDGSSVPAQISVRETAKDRSGRVTIGMVVTDMSEARKTEELLRALTHRVVQVQEAERARVALELHDNITQLICAVVFRSQALAESLSARDGPAKNEAIKLCALLGQTAEEVERISRDLRPSILDQLGLIAVMRATSTEFTARTGVPVRLSCEKLPVRLSADAELALYRIYQEALKNVEQHSRAHKVAVGLKLQDASVQLTIKDDGVSFDPDHHPARQKGGLGLLSMRERASYVGGILTVKSVRGAGTEIQVRIPFGSVSKPNQTKPRLKTTTGFG
jgi:two-component system, NarL family, sensor kinase